MELSRKDFRVDVKNFSANISQVTQNGIVVLVDNERRFTISSNELRSWAQEYTRSYTGEKDTRIDAGKAYDYLKSIAPSINRDPVNAKFTFENNRASIFVPAVAGKTLDIEASTVALRNAIASAQSEVNLVVASTEPEITLEKINNLGITSIIGIGESNFVGSSVARVQNIRIAAAKYNGLILKPSEELSFNTILGPVDETGGYVAEKVIKGKALVYEYGGGICQVSTTLFRAAIYAGFPIKERKNHSFPVQYYNPQGFDATIYPGVQDLKFVNNTSTHVLLQTRIAGTKLYFEVYGSDDGRQVEVSTPIQYDQKPDGSMKAYFTRTISYEDKPAAPEEGEPRLERQEQKETFYSNYRSPALYPLQRNPLE